MPGTEAIVGILGEVDRAVQLDPLARLRVSQFLPQYQTPGVRWYDDFMEWLAETRAEPGDFPRWLAESSEGLTPEGPRASRPFPNVIEALDELTAEDLADARVRARLVFASAVSARAFPKIEERESFLDQQAVSTLGKFMPDEPSARELFELLSDDRPERFGIRQIPGTRGWWQGVLRFLDSKGIETTGMEPKPCTARLVTVPGIDGPAAALRTEFDTKTLEFDRATNFMAPENWKKCRPDFWCRMKREPDPKPGDGQCRYHEIVSNNCKDPRALFRAETRLLFNFMWILNEGEVQAAVANYELAEQPSRRNDLIQVDEGSLLVSKLDWRPKSVRAAAVPGRETLRITTTKRIKFNYPFSSYALALIVCALGWLDTGAQLVACAARKDKRFTGTPFPGEPATDAIKPRAAQAARAAGPSGGAPGSLIDLCQEGVDIWARALRDGAAALERHGGGGPKEQARRQPRSGS